jgi:hypothetical protein
VGGLQTVEAGVADGGGRGQKDDGRGGARRNAAAANAASANASTK